MKKSEFLAELRERLSRLPEEDIKESLDYYGEMIDDRIEDGLCEEDAVSAVGRPEDIANSILAQTPLERITKKCKDAGKKLGAWEIVLLVLGSPLWITLLAAALVIAIALVISVASVYISLWTVVIAIWAVAIALAVCAPTGIALLVFCAVHGNVGLGLFFLGCGLLCAGLSSFVFMGAHYASKGLGLLLKAVFSLIKRCFKRKGASR